MVCMPTFPSQPSTADKRHLLSYRRVRRHISSPGNDGDPARLEVEASERGAPSILAELGIGRIEPSTHRQGHSIQVETVGEFRCRLRGELACRFTTARNDRAPRFRCRPRARPRAMVRPVGRIARIADHANPMGLSGDPHATSVQRLQVGLGNASRIAFARSRNFPAVHLIMARSVACGICALNMSVRISASRANGTNWTLPRYVT